MRSFWWRRLAALAVVVYSHSGAAAAQLAEFYVGVDGRTAAFTAAPADGGGNYPSNPNFGRLTFLFNHVDHFHGIGAYRFTGPAASPTLEDTNANNRIPETYTAQQPLPLLAGSGVYAGKFATAHLPGVEYSNLEMRNVQSLAGVDNVLYSSSGNRWSGLFNDADVHLQLVSVSSPNLSVGSPSNPNALPVGSDIHVGEGDEVFSFTPVLWVDAVAPAGNYWAEFRLLDLSGNFGSSGRFFVDVQHVPEPASIALLVSCATASVAKFRRHR